MKRNALKTVTFATGVAACAAFTSGAHAQSSDALLDKLVDKGILTAKEAKDLRTETDKGFAKAYSAKSGMPAWVTAFKINGDFRGRYEHFSSENDLFTDRSRWRYRLRVGMTAVLQDNFEVGLRLSSSEPGANSSNNEGDPISSNTTLANNGSRKLVFLDLAYGKWTFLNRKELTASATIGKMENPFVFSDMVFDGDYTPEGGAVNLTYRLNDKHTFKLNGGAFILDEVSGDSNDPYMLGGQVRWDAAWNQRIASSFGAAALTIANEQLLSTNAVQNIQRGNTRLLAAGSTPAVNFNPIVLDGSLTYTFDEMPFYSGKFPVRLVGEYMNNTAIDDREYGVQAGVTFGKAGKKGTWEVSYRYKHLSGDAWYEEFVDSDFGAYYGGTFPGSGLGSGYGSGTNIRGHIVKASYSPYDALTLSATYFKAYAIDDVFNATDNSTGMGRLQLDAVWKF